MTERTITVVDAIKSATAGMLRREIKNRVDAESGGLDDYGEYIEPDGDTVVEDLESLNAAKAYWQRGDRREALHHLEYALGRDFIGLGDLRPEDLR